jgi:hypothetical protein
MRRFGWLDISLKRSAHILFDWRNLEIQHRRYLRSTGVNECLSQPFAELNRKLPYRYIYNRTIQSCYLFRGQFRNGERSNHVEEISLSKNGLDDNTTVGHCNQQQPMRRCAWIFRRVNDIKKDKDDDGIVYLTGYQTFGGDC